MTEVRFDVIEDIGEISRNARSRWRKLLRVVSWNDGDAKYDIRDWSPEGNPGRGITLTSEEFKALTRIIKER